MDLTLDKLYTEYHKYIVLKLKPTTLLHVERIFNKQILPFLGKTNIKDLNLDIYVDWLEKLKGLNYSKSFYNYIQSCFKDFLRYLSLSYDIKDYSKLFNLTLESRNNKSIKINTWTLKEYKKFIKKVDNNIYHALFNTLYFTGIRKGEALALHFSDLEGNYLNINKSLTKEFFNGKRLELEPKTKKSIRKIRIDKKLLRELNKLRDYYITHYDNYNNNFYIFGGNKPIPTTTLERKKDKYCDLAEVKRIRIHDFRHSHATMLYQKHIDPKTIQERLGHSDISTTLNIYVHSDRKQEKKLINKINFLRL